MRFGVPGSKSTQRFTPHATAFQAAVASGSVWTSRPTPCEKAKGSAPWCRTSWVRCTTSGAAAGRRDSSAPTSTVDSRPPRGLSRRPVVGKEVGDLEVLQERAHCARVLAVIKGARADRQGIWPGSHPLWSRRGRGGCPYFQMTGDSQRVTSRWCRQ